MATPQQMDVSEFVDATRLLHLRAVAAQADGGPLDIAPDLALVLCRLAVPQLYRLLPENRNAP